MPDNNIQFWWSEYLHAGSCRTADRCRNWQPAAAEESVEVDRDIVGADTVTADNELAGAGLAGGDHAHSNRVNCTGAVDVGNVGAESGLDR